MSRTLSLVLMVVTMTQARFLGYGRGPCAYPDPVAGFDFSRVTAPIHVLITNNSPQKRLVK